MYIDTWISAISAVGEWAIAIVILWEWEGSRVDHFIEDVGTEESTRGRTKIFSEYLKISEGTQPRNELFKEELEKPENKELRETCAESIRCLSRIGARMPWIWPLKNIVLDWHVVVFLWEILGPYVRQKRNEVGTSYATSFLRYALASLERLLKQKRKQWTIRDPALPKKVVVLTRNHMEQMKGELRGILDA
jgi:hypothetical protein